MKYLTKAKELTGPNQTKPKPCEHRRSLGDDASSSETVVRASALVSVGELLGDGGVEAARGRSISRRREGRRGGELWTSGGGGVG